MILQVIDETISSEDFERLQHEIESNAAVRKAYLDSMRLSSSLEEIAADTDQFAQSTQNQSNPVSHSRDAVPTPFQWRRIVLRYATAACLLICVAGLAFRLGSWNANQTTASNPEQSNAETQLAGHATVRRTFDLESMSSSRFVEGEVLGQGEVRFDSGMMEIDFFCGATLLVQGPAQFTIESDWAVTLEKGLVRANVPPPAQGFTVKTSTSEIVDLGTEFVLDVDEENSSVKVLDGEIELRGGSFDGQHLFTGESQVLKGQESADASVAELSTASDLRAQRNKDESNRLNEWQAWVNQQAKDKRLIAYFPLAAKDWTRKLTNLVASPDRDALLLGPVESSSGRFGSNSSGISFSRPGARARLRIDGEFEAFTFACWVRINNLDHRYNALFMGDGYENGEPHWQIRDDGKLMFSVMVDDSQEVRLYSERDQQIVEDAGLHRVYFTEPIWDLTESGKWMHLAAVYDPKNRIVSQFVNGARVSREQIEDRFYIQKLRIGPAEIGNWGQPFRKSPWFAVRNLNGTIDEFAAYETALSDQEIQQLYESGKPIGY